MKARQKPKKWGRKNVRPLSPRLSYSNCSSRFLHDYNWKGQLAARRIEACQGKRTRLSFKLPNRVLKCCSSLIHLRCGSFNLLGTSAVRTIGVEDVEVDRNCRREGEAQVELRAEGSCPRGSLSSRGEQEQVHCSIGAPLRAPE